MYIYHQCRTYTAKKQQQKALPNIHNVVSFHILIFIFEEMKRKFNEKLYVIFFTVPWKKII